MIWYDLAILMLSSMATPSPWYRSITVLSSFKCVSLLSFWDNNGLLYRMLLAFRTQLLTLFVAVKCLLLPFKFIIKQLFTVLFTSRSHGISIFNSYWPHVTKAFIFFKFVCFDFEDSELVGLFFSQLILSICPHFGSQLSCLIPKYMLWASQFLIGPFALDMISVTALNKHSKDHAMNF